MYGPIESSWKIESDIMTLDVEIPPNTTATVLIPAVDIKNILAQGTDLKETKGVLKTSQKNDKAIISIGSGRYSFKVGINKFDR